MQRHTFLDFGFKIISTTHKEVIQKWRQMKIYPDLSLIPDQLPSNILTSFMNDFQACKSSVVATYFHFIMVIVECTLQLEISMQTERFFDTITSYKIMVPWYFYELVLLRTLITLRLLYRRLICTGVCKISMGALVLTTFIKFYLADFSISLLYWKIFEKVVFELVY